MFLFRFLRQALFQEGIEKEDGYSCVIVIFENLQLFECTEGAVYHMLACQLGVRSCHITIKRENQLSMDETLNPYRVGIEFRV
jgi:hypothetical protein